MWIEVFAMTAAEADRDNRIRLANSQMITVDGNVASGDVIGKIDVRQFQSDGAVINNRYIAPTKPGVVILIDDQRDVLESRAEAEALIEQIRKAADEMWPQ